MLNQLKSNFELVEEKHLELKNKMSMKEEFIETLNAELKHHKVALQAKSKEVTLIFRRLVKVDEMFSSN